MKVNLLYLAWNRREYVEATFAAMLKHTDWSQVGTVHVHDDASTDGTREFLERAIKDVPAPVLFESLRLKSPVAVQNRHLDLVPETEEIGAYIKLDSDFVVCPGWLQELTRVASLDPGCDFVGLQPRFGPPVAGEYADRRIEAARHIGGIGFMRYRAFEVCRPVPNGFWGFSEFQTRHPESRKGWLTPDLPAFGLDLISAKPWSDLAAEYVAKGWSRAWPQYVNGGLEYCQWWLDEQV